MTDLGRFPHYMIKEIFEQPESLRATLDGRVCPQDGSVHMEEIGLASKDIERLRRITIIASGTSRHAGMVGRYMIEELAKLPVDVEYASEFELCDLHPAELTIVITQSGETADTSGAQRKAKARGSRTLAISNVVDSMIARDADGVLYTQAGPETSIASTKAFTAQMVVLFLFALHLGKVRGTIQRDQLNGYVQGLAYLPAKLERVLQSAAKCDSLAEKYQSFDDCLVLGRGVHYPVAMDGALKLKEVSYIHAEGYPTGEFQHGPNALISENLPLLILSTCDITDPGSVVRHERDLAAVKKFKQQSADVIVLASEGDQELSRLSDDTINIPHVSELLAPILEIVPLQMFAYYMAVRRGLNVDRPRNLVKSVTAEI